MPAPGHIIRAILAGALFATFTVTPALASLMLPQNIHEVETFLVRALRFVYEPVLHWSLGHRKTMAVIALVFPLVILAVLSLCVWAGLHFYQRRVAPKTRSGTGQRFAPRKPGANGFLLIPDVCPTEEGEHEFTA